MKKPKFSKLLTLIATLLSALPLRAGEPPVEARPPIMGWSSWNNYRIHITESIIKAQADAMASNGMVDVGYTYINIDDGFFGGRDAQGNLLVHPQRFPNGMKSLARYIHARGLKAGIYTDGGINTCGSHWDKDSISLGCGLYGHAYEDLTLMLGEWDYDFIKVDWCGGDWMGLDDESHYRAISEMIYDIRPDATFNICRWKFPGEWAIQIADSWRVSGDIAAEFGSICHIIDLNADLWMHCSPGHYNDMDMLQIGRGMSYEEDKAHFTMWCMMVSPLLAGNDLTKMSKETLSIITNADVIALNQDPLFYQARRVADGGDLEVWAKPLTHTMSGRVAVTLLNRSQKSQSIEFLLQSVGIDAAKGYTMRDLWSKQAYGESTEVNRSFEVPSHGVVTLLIEGESLAFNVFQKK